MPRGMRCRVSHPGENVIGGGREWGECDWGGEYFPTYTYYRWWWGYATIPGYAFLLYLVCHSMMLINYTVEHWSSGLQLVMVVYTSEKTMHLLYNVHICGIDTHMYYFVTRLIRALFEECQFLIQHFPQNVCRRADITIMPLLLDQSCSTGSLIHNRRPTQSTLHKS